MANSVLVFIITTLPPLKGLGGRCTRVSVIMESIHYLYSVYIVPFPDGTLDNRWTMHIAHGSQDLQAVDKESLLGGPEPK